MEKNQDGVPQGNARLRSRLPALSPSEGAVARWILKHLSEIGSLSMAEIAAACGVSDTTVLRMCRNAGFKGFTDLKLSLLQSGVEPERLFLEDARPGDDIVTIARKIFSEEIQSMRDTLELLTEEKLEKAVRLLETSRRTLIAGVGTSGIIGRAAWSLWRRAGRACTAPVDIHHQIAEAVLLEPGDLAVVLSYTGRSRDTLEVAETARNQGASVIAITGNERSLITQYADVVLVSVSRQRKSDPLSSRVSQLALFDTLYVILSLRNLEQTLASDEKINRAIMPRTL